jgi:hypothetical protein
MRLQPVPYLKLWFSVPVVLFIVQGIDLCSAPYRTGTAAAQKVESISVPGSKAFPESITSTSDGALFVGRLGDGGIVRIKPKRSGEHRIRPTGRIGFALDPGSLRG